MLVLVKIIKIKIKKILSIVDKENSTWYSVKGAFVYRFLSIGRSDWYKGQTYHKQSWLRFAALFFCWKKNHLDVWTRK